jgi:hypothetical protein
MMNDDDEEKKDDQEECRINQLKIYFLSEDK